MDRQSGGLYSLDRNPLWGYDRAPRHCPGLPLVVRGRVSGSLYQTRTSRGLCMIGVALRRLLSRFWLTLLSIAGVTLAVGLVVSIPIFSQAVSFVMLSEELNEISAQTGRPLFSVRVYVLPAAKYTLPLEECETLGNHLGDTLVSEVGLPLLSLNRHLETTGIVIRTRGVETPYGEPFTFLGETKLTVLPGAESRITTLEGDPMDADSSSASQGGDELDVWMHKITADNMGIRAGERFEVRDLRRSISVPIRIAGIWVATDPTDTYWFSNPDMSLRRALLAREADYQAIVEPAFEQQLGFASWYLVLDASKLVPERMQEYADGLRNGFKVIGKYLPESRPDFSPVEALDMAIARETNLTVLLFAFSVPLMGFLIYFLTLISTITIRWQRRETAVMASRGLRSGQMLVVGLIEALIMIGLGCPLGLLAGVQLARLMGYTQGFMAVTATIILPNLVFGYFFKRTERRWNAWASLAR